MTTENDNPTPEPETVVGAAPEADARFSTGRYLDRPLYVCAGKGCKYATTNHGRILTHVAHCRRLTQD